MKLTIKQAYGFKSYETLETSPFHHSLNLGSCQRLSLPTDSADDASIYNLLKPPSLRVIIVIVTPNPLREYTGF